MDMKNEEWVPVFQASNEIEANIIESIFKSEDIPVLKRYREAGEYLMLYMGMTNMGIDIFVPADLEIKAKQILDSAIQEEAKDYED